MNSITPDKNLKNNFYYHKPGLISLGPLQWLINEDQENSQVVASPYGRATFTCHVRGEPSIHAEWFEDGVPIREGPSLRKTNVSF